MNTKHVQSFDFLHISVLNNNPYYILRQNDFDLFQNLELWYIYASFFSSFLMYVSECFFNIYFVFIDCI